ncbi:hypothetical protein ACWGKW_29995 [Streptomyces sp. NPDC054766]
MTDIRTRAEQEAGLPYEGERHGHPYEGKRHTGHPYEGEVIAS